MALQYGKHAYYWEDQPILMSTQYSWSCVKTKLKIVYNDLVLNYVWHNWCNPHCHLKITPALAIWSRREIAKIIQQWKQAEPI